MKNSIVCILSLCLALLGAAEASAKKRSDRLSKKRADRIAQVATDGTTQVDGTSKDFVWEIGAGASYIPTFEGPPLPTIMVIGEGNPAGGAFRFQGEVSVASEYGFAMFNLQMGLRLYSGADRNGAFFEPHASLVGIQEGFELYSFGMDFGYKAEMGDGLSMTFLVDPMHLVIPRMFIGEANTRSELRLLLGTLMSPLVAASISYQF